MFAIETCVLSALRQGSWASPSLAWLGGDWAAWLAGAAVGCLCVWGIVIYNLMVRGRNLVLEGWSGVDVQLQRRHNLVPNLVEVVKAYAAHERGVLEEVASLRARSAQATEIRQRELSENALTDGLKRLLALAEAYPDLKANRNFLDLQNTLTRIEDQIQMARRYYNGAVRNYNILVETFPNNLLAGVLHRRRADFFQIVTTSDREAPKVEIP